MDVEYEAETYDEDMQNLLEKINKMPCAPKEFEDLEELTEYLLSEEHKFKPQEERCEAAAVDSVEFLLAMKNFKSISGQGSESAEKYPKEMWKELQRNVRNREHRMRAKELQSAQNDDDIISARGIF